ncbi:GDP-fucose protein O-fucosyltransferase 1-like isoform X1 [Haliotis asinina]|uniref:GDP-fucose protein O-fucosyltransferase 1-like isoform X1 n=2 Tax=Haliotis asinina TaxID=109174 RepID=UPI003531C7FF
MHLTEMFPIKMDRLQAMITVIVILIFNFIGQLNSEEVDSNGYIAYCPCMGRFGNQADQFLGALRFASSINRTLILPPWVEYRRGQSRSVQVAFDTYFKVSEVAKFHRVITMERFMKKLAPTLWPPGQRISFCHSERTYGEKKNDCNAKDGNPFASFWDTYNIDFDKSEFFSPLYYDTESAHEMKRWQKRYPGDKYPVLAFTGPPGAFPVQRADVPLQKYVRWSDKYEKMADDFIAKNIKDKPFIGIHLRNGIDFKRACEHMDSSENMFASPQCVGYRGEKGKATKETCYPSDKSVVKKVKAEVKRLNAGTVFVATDDRDLIDVMQKAMKKVKFVKQSSPASPHLDLAILGKADHFIGNCISTFTAFAKRERDTKGLSSSFWAFEPKQKKDEL